MTLTFEWPFDLLCLHFDYSSKSSCIMKDIREYLLLLQLSNLSKLLKEMVISIDENAKYLEISEKW